MEHRAAATFLILLIDSRQGRGVEMAPLEGPEGWSRSNTVESTSALKSNCVFLTGSLVHTGGCADTGVVHTGAFYWLCSRSQPVIFPPPLIRRKNSNRMEYNVHFPSYVGTFSIFSFIFRQKEKSYRPSDQ